MEPHTEAGAKGTIPASDSNQHLSYLEKLQKAKQNQTIPQPTEAEKFSTTGKVSHQSFFKAPPAKNTTQNQQAKAKLTVTKPLAEHRSTGSPDKPKRSLIPRIVRGLVSEPVVLAIGKAMPSWMSTQDISIHFRENNESTLARMWVICALFYLALFVVSLLFGSVDWILGLGTGLGVISILSLLLLLTAVSFLLIRSSMAWKNHDILEKRFSRKVMVTSSANLQQDKKLRTHLWLGAGFYWRASHAFRREIVRQKLDNGQHPEYPDVADRAIGNSWLHTLEFEEKNIYLDVSHTNGHMLVVGTTGAGKTRCFDLLIQQAILRNETVIIIDPKGDHDLREKAMRACHKLNVADKFFVFNPAFPQQSVAIDCFASFEQANHLAERIVNMVPQTPEGQVFRSSQYAHITTIISALLYVKQKITFVKIFNALNNGVHVLIIDTLKQYIKNNNLEEEICSVDQLTMEMSKKELVEIFGYICQQGYNFLGTQTIRELFGIYQAPQDHLKKMIASILPVLHSMSQPPMNLLITPEVQDLSRVELKMSDVCSSFHVLYIGLNSLADGTLGSNLGALILSDLTFLSATIYNAKPVKLPVNIFIDEAAEVANAPFIQILNKGRGAGFRCITATQTIADFIVRLGDEAAARQMLGNFNNWIALRTVDAETCRYLADSIGQTRVAVKGGSFTYDEMVSADRHAYNITMDKTDLITPEMFSELPNFEYIAKVSGGEIIKGRLPIVE